MAGSLRSSGSSIFNAADDEGPLFPIFVSHVCRHWREVALNSHTLWSTLDFDNVLQLEKLKVFIERAHDLPLEGWWWFKFSFSEQIDADPQTRYFTEGELDFHVSNYSYVQSLLSRLHKILNAPLLKKIHVYHHEQFDDFEFFSGSDKTQLHSFPRGRTFTRIRHLLGASTLIGTTHFISPRFTWIWVIFPF